MLTTVGVDTEQKVVKTSFQYEKDYVKVRAQNRQEESIAELFMQMAKAGNMHVVKCFVENSNMNPNLRDSKGWTAILRASKANQVEIVQYLASKRADLNTQTMNLNTPLHKSAKKGHLQIANVLIEAKCEVNLQNKGGATPLMLACLHRHSLWVLIRLIEALAEVDARKDTGYTALMIAARLNNCKAAAELIKAKVNVHMVDSKHETALQKAQRQQADDIVRLLLQSGAKQASGHSAAADTKSKGSSTKGKSSS